jgi:hypothetical protein
VEYNLTCLLLYFNCSVLSQVEQAIANEGDDDEIEDVVADDIEEEEVFNDETAEKGGAGTDLSDSILDGSSRQILVGQIDPLEWKTELERVSQKLKTGQVASTNEWRAHVDQTISSKENIDKLLGDTKGDLAGLNQ